MELCTIQGCPKANSYLELEEADELMPLYDPDWSKRSEEEKAILLITSANDIDRVPLLGSQMFFGQRLQWPRIRDVLVESYTLAEGFERDIVTDTITKDVVHQESMDGTLKIGQDYAEFSIIDPRWQPFGDNAQVVVRGVLPDETEFAATLALQPYLHITPEIKDEFGVVIHPAVEEQRLKAVWTKLYHGTKYDRPLPEVPIPSDRMPDVHWDEETNTFHIYALNGGFFDPTTDIVGVVSEYTTSEEETVERENVSGITNPAFVSPNRQDLLPEYFYGGALHVIHSGKRDYHKVLSCNMETGTLAVTGELYTPASEEEVVTYLYIDPLRKEVKDAQLVQLRVRAGDPTMVTDPFAGLGLGSIQIGDTKRTYATGGTSYSALADIANRLGVHVQTMVILGKFSIYGKVSMGWQQRIEDALETPLTTTTTTTE